MKDLLQIAMGHLAQPIEQKVQHQDKLKELKTIIVLGTIALG